MAVDGDSIAIEDAAPALRVLHVAARDVAARFAPMFRPLALALHDQGVHVSLLTDDPALAADVETTPIEPHLVSALTGWRSWWAGRTMSPALESNPPEVVHVWGAGRPGVLTDWVQRRGTPTLLHALSTRDVERLKRRGLRANETAAGACEEFRETLRQRWPTPAQPIEALEPGLLVPEHPAGLSSDEHTLGVMWTGRIDNHSGLDVLIDAVAQLHRKEIDLQVALIGDGPGRRAVWQRLRRENVHDCVSLIDEPSLWPRALRGADALVVPNCQHTLALAPLAAMARGTIVIASRDQLADWFIEDRTSWEFNPGSAVELAYHLSRVAQRHPHARALSRTAAAYVRSEHTITDQAERLAALYARLASSAADELTVAPGVA